MQPNSYYALHRDKILKQQAEYRAEYRKFRIHAGLPIRPHLNDIPEDQFRTAFASSTYMTEAIRKLGYGKNFGSNTVVAVRKFLVKYGVDISHFVPYGRRGTHNKFAVGHKVTPQHRDKIAAAQRERWAKYRKEKLGDPAHEQADHRAG